MDAELIPLPNNPTLEATALGLLLKDGVLVVGDYVELEPRKDEWLITALLKRKNEVNRSLQRENKTKILASNIDYLILVFSMERPEFKRGLLDRYLLRSVQWNIPALLVFNKCDMATEDLDWAFEFERIKDLIEGFYCLSALHPSTPAVVANAHSLEHLISLLENHTVIFLGQSGVGKSKLIQFLGKGQIQTKSHDLGVVGKGVHTTSWAELHLLPTLSLIDSPGIRSLSINDIALQDLMGLMPDLHQQVSKCKFHNCGHEENAKGCFFWSKDCSKILQSRFQSYLRFKEEIQSGKSWEKETT